MVEGRSLGRVGLGKGLALELLDGQSHFFDVRFCQVVDPFAVLEVFPIPG